MASESTVPPAAAGQALESTTPASVAINEKKSTSNDASSANAAAKTEETQKNTSLPAATKKEETQASKPAPNEEKNDHEVLIESSLYRLTEGLPKAELRTMISEADACEKDLLHEIQLLEDALKTNSQQPTRSPVEIMLQSEITPPDRFYTASALFGRLRDGLATPLPPNSTLPAARLKAASASAASNTSQNNKKRKGTPVNAPGNAATSLEPVERRLLALMANPEYRRKHTDATALLSAWKKISTHRTSGVFRRPVNPKEAPGYTERILFPMDLSLIRKMIVGRIVQSYADLHQRIGLITHNCVKFNGRESDYGVVAREFEAMADEVILQAVAVASAKATAISTTATTSTQATTTNAPQATSR